MSIGETIEVKSSTLTYRGDALGHDSGRAVFVPFALPGERIRARVVEERRGFVRAELVEMLDPSPQRISPGCRHFTSCGGCHYQHIPYAMQVKVKEEILHDQLVRIGKFTSPPVRPSVTSPAEWNYRNDVQFLLTKGRFIGPGLAGRHQQSGKKDGDSAERRRASRYGWSLPGECRSPGMVRTDR